MTGLIAIVDIEPVPPNLDAFVSAKRFGDIVFRRRRLVEHTVRAFRSMGDVVVAVVNDATAAGEMLRRFPECDRVVHIPTWLAPTRLDACVDRIQRLLLVDQPCIGKLGGQALPMAAGPIDLYSGLPQLLSAPASEVTKLVPKALGVDLGHGFTDLRQPDGLIDYLSGAFTARHFNSVERTRFHVRKRSADIAKIRAEHDFYHMIPPQMQRWLVMPFDLKIDSHAASYTMERLLVLDMGQQWISGGISVAEFKRFLDDVGGFFDARASRPCDRKTAERNFDEVYIDKVRRRVAQFDQTPVARTLRGLVAIGSRFKSLDCLLEAYLDLAASLRTQLPDHEVIGHGDPCLSNVLYDKRIRLLKLIDPRGASRKEDLWGDPHYDYAKLSHSVLGGYDFVINGMCNVSFDSDLTLQLTTYEQSWESYGTAFVGHLQQRGIDPRRVRILEASLFLSMLPLHVDVPRNVLAFILIAAHIVAEAQNQ